VATKSRSPRKPRGIDPEKRGNDNIEWIEKNCLIPEGRDVGKPVKLREWQRDVIRSIYNNPAGTRRAIISFGRKNAKTTLSAFLLLLHLCGREHRLNSQLFSSAQSRDQAAILFALAAKIVRMSPKLRDFIVVRDTAKQLFCPRLGTLYRALSADASTAYGLSPVLTIHDELGQVRGPRSELYEALETATGAQENPLSIIISTQAPTDADLLSVLIDDALAGHDPRVVVSLHTAPLELDAFSEDAIRLANPAYGDFLNADEVRAMAADAQRMPSREANYRNLVLNQRVEASSPFVSRALWETCGDKPTPIDRVHVYGGLDLSAVNDLTALVLIGCVDGIWQVHPAFWLPADGLRDKAAKDRVPYDVWNDSGHLLAAPGKSVDYEFVSNYLRSVFDEYNVVKIAFDRWGFKHLRPWLIKAGFSEDQIEEHFEEFGQGFQSMSPALRDLEGEILNKRIAHGNHPVLSMCAANAVVQSDPAGNRKLAKHKSAGRIDGMLALTMAMGVAPLNGEVSVSVYDQLGPDYHTDDNDEAILRNPAHPNWYEARERWEQRYLDGTDFDDAVV
jgi:phage terminase large subunit-like protein